MVKPKDGEFVVFKGRYSFYVHQVVRVTSQLYFYKDGDRERRARMDELIFAGTKDVANNLAAQLTSSRAQYDQECRSAYERRTNREAQLIDSATPKQPE